MANIIVNNTAIYAVPCACQWHPLESPDWQRNIDISHVGNIQGALRDFPEMQAAILKTITIIHDEALKKLYILDGQHRYRALMNECGVNNHICFAVQLVPGTYTSAYRLYTQTETRALPHDPYVHLTTRPDETQFLYQAKNYLRGLDMKSDGTNRPTVNIDLLFKVYQEAKLPPNLPAFREWIEDRNTKIKAAIARLPIETRGCPDLGKTTLTKCQKYKYWFGLYCLSNC